jgi:hypothetical protein
MFLLCFDWLPLGLFYVVRALPTGNEAFLKLEAELPVRLMLTS